MTQQAKIQHLYWRAGFGATNADIQRLQNLSWSQIIEQLFQDSAKDSPVIVQEGVSPKVADILMADKKERREILGKSRQAIRTLNARWLEQMSNTQAQLREKMTLFWHGHFACQPKSIYNAQKQINNLRKSALGNFGDLVLSIAKDPAMIAFLNNQQNRKRSPNENFARELMELFTLGRGNYTEQDIKESARAFTGWGFDGDEYIFRESQHDFDEKTFMGKTGNLNGEDIIRIILAKPETATFIVTKIYKFLVNEEVIDTQVIQALARKFYQSEYDISALLREIFMSEWFYAPQNVGNKIKSPIALLAGMQRQLGMRFSNERAPLFIQKILGQVLLYPPNVAGWKGGKAWIDSSTLLFRLQLPQLIYKASAVGISAKEEEDVNKADLVENLRKIEATFNWSILEQQLGTAKDTAALYQNMANYMLQTQSPTIKRHLTALTDKPLSSMLIRELAIALASMPEYQIC
jgi:uncharacterized protein (DUF1800 family)